MNTTTTTTTITIPKNLIKNDDLVIIPRRKYEAFLEVFKIFREKKQIIEKDVLVWSREAKKLKEEGKLPLLRSLKDFR